MLAKLQRYGGSLLNPWWVPVGCALVSWYIGLDTSWDVQNYHYYNAWALLNARSELDLAPAGLQTYFNPLLDLWWYSLLQTLPLPMAGFVMGFVHGCNFLLVRKLALRLFGHVSWVKPLGWLLGFFAVLSIGFLSELGTAMHDNFMALCVLGSLNLCLAAQLNPSGQRTNYILLAGAIAGLACAAKLTSAIYALALGLALLCENCVHERQWRHRLQGAALYSAAVVSVVLVVGGYWYWSNWSRFGNPLFPMFNDVFQSEWAAPNGNRDARFLPATWLDWLVRPVLLAFQHSLASEIPYYTYGFTLVFLTAVLAALKFTWRKIGGTTGDIVWSRGTTLIAVFAISAWTLWLALFGIYRYLIPLELLLPVLLTLLLSYVMGQQRGLIATVAICVLLSINNLNKAPSWGHARWSKDYVSVQLPADSASVGSVLLLGQPLAWLVPAFNLPVPFLQIDPNFSVDNSRYGAELLARIDTSKPVRAIYDTKTYNWDAAVQRITAYGFSLQENDCEPLLAAMGSQTFEYRYCLLSR